MEINKKYLSVAIPTYNSSKYLLSSINSVKNYEFVNEIIVHDDFSKEKDYENILKIKENLKNEIDIKVFRNKTNYGAFINKFLNVKECSNEYVYQLDSDNICASNLNSVFSEIINENQKRFMYLPSKIYQFYTYPRLARVASFFLKKYNVTYTKANFNFTKENIKKAIVENKKITVNKNINWVLNSGNYIVNKEMFINTMEKHIDFDKRHPLDAVAISFFWIANKGEIKTLKNLSHYHRKREDSVSFIENEGSFESLQMFRNKFVELD